MKGKIDMNIKTKECYTDQFKLYNDLKQATYFALVEIEKIMFEYKNNKFTAEETLQQIENLFNGFNIFDTERHIWFLEEANKVFSGKKEVTKITPEKFSQSIECLRKQYCPSCENDIACENVDCIVMRAYWLLKEHLKDECKKQLKGTSNGTCEGCAHEYKCSIKSSEHELF